MWLRIVSSAEFGISGLETLDSVTCWVLWK
jgi:hypothetical protein